MLRRPRTPVLACALTLLLAPAAAVAAPSAPELAARASATALPTPLPLATVAAPRQVPAPAPAPDPAPAPTDAPAPEVPLSGPPAAPPGGWVSEARGTWSRGSLVRGVELPAASAVHLTWDAVLDRSPNRAWRRFGTDRLVATLLQVATDFRNAHRDRPPILIADLSRPRGGVFDSRYGGLGHLSHRNGLDADVQFPRRDGRPIGPRTWRDVDRALAQELVDRFVAAGAVKVFVGPRLRLRGPKDVVVPLAHHDDHLHVRLALRAP